MNATTFSAARLHHNAYPTKDMEATRHFYEDIIGMPLVATSANISGFPTCKEASEVLAALGAHLSLILDSSIPNAHIATTVDLTVPKWRLIRPGAISEEELREFLGE